MKHSATIILLVLNLQLYSQVTIKHNKNHFVISYDYTSTYGDSISVSNDDIYAFNRHDTIFLTEKYWSRISTLDPDYQRLKDEIEICAQKPGFGPKDGFNWKIARSGQQMSSGIGITIDSCCIYLEGNIYDDVHGYYNGRVPFVCFDENERFLPLSWFSGKSGFVNYTWLFPILANYYTYRDTLIVVDGISRPCFLFRIDDIGLRKHVLRNPRKNFILIDKEILVPLEVTYEIFAGGKTPEEDNAIQYSWKATKLFLGKQRKQEAIVSEIFRIKPPIRKGDKWSQWNILFN